MLCALSKLYLAEQATEYTIRHEAITTGYCRMWVALTLDPEVVIHLMVPGRLQLKLIVNFGIIAQTSGYKNTFAGVSHVFGVNNSDNYGIALSKNIGSFL